VVSSFLEIVDNAFTHNLGRWPTKYYKRVTSLFINDIKKKNFTIAVADLGIGFKETLKLKYPEVQSETEAIQLAVQANTSSRPVDYKGQKMGGIRSCNCFCEVLSVNQVKQLEIDLPYSYGAKVLFKLSYA